MLSLAMLVALHRLGRRGTAPRSAASSSFPAVWLVLSALLYRRTKATRRERHRPQPVSAPPRAPGLGVHPGRLPPGRDLDGGGTNFALFSEVAHRVELCLFDDDGRETRYELTEVDGASGTPTCPASGQASATATGSTARTTRARPALQPGQAAPRPLRQGGRRAMMGPAFSATASGTRQPNDDDSRPVRCRRRS